MRILLADDQPHICSALRLVLEYEPNLQVIGEVSNTTDLLTQTRTSRPDLVLLDWELPGQPTSDLLGKLRKYQPDMSVIALSSRPEARQNAVAAGVDAFIDKGYPAEQLLMTLRIMGREGSGAIKKILVKDWMTPEVVTISSRMALSKAYRIMTTHSVRRLPVVDSGALVGLITLSDVQKAQPLDNRTRNVWDLNFAITEIEVAQIMVTDLVTIGPDVAIMKAARWMRQHQIGALPVVDDEGVLVGIITESDIFRRIVQTWIDD